MRRLGECRLREVGRSFQGCVIYAKAALSSICLYQNISVSDHLADFILPRGVSSRVPIRSASPPIRYSAPTFIFALGNSEMSVVRWLLSQGLGRGTARKAETGDGILG